MKNKTILTRNQQALLDEVGKNKSITDAFYLGGGTALAEYYLKHRLSEDLDFFSEQEFDPQSIFIFFKKHQKDLKIKKKWSVEALLKKARIKFDWHIDLLQFGTQLMKATEVKDYPKMLIKISPKTWQDFFLVEAKKIGKDIIQ